MVKFQEEKHNRELIETKYEALKHQIDQLQIQIGKDETKIEQLENDRTVNKI